MNKNKTIILILMLTLSSSLLFAQFSGGSGTEADPYKISSEEDKKTLAQLIRLDSLDDFGENVTWSYGKYFILYDLKTKSYNVFAPDNALFTHIPGYPPRIYYPGYADYFKNANGEDCIGILYSNGDFFSCNPKTGIFDLEAGGLPDLWFRKIYPNPAPQRSVNADIMCYVQDLNKIDIGLYNLLGEKILDLNSDYEYNDATKTIYVRFNVPQSFPTGTYYLNINNGAEYRTKAIIIGQ